MERLEGHINPRFLDQQVDVEGLGVSGFVNAQRFGLEEEEEVQQLSTPTLLDTIPFLQMLQIGESPPFLSLKEPNFLALLSLQPLKKPWELESSLTHEVPDFHSPMKSENNSFYQYPPSTYATEGVDPAVSSQELAFNPQENMQSGSNIVPSSSPPPGTTSSRNKRKHSRLPPEMARERRKRKRTAAKKNKEEVENQRMTHIAVERNRRRQMNDHLNSLRFLMPPSFIQRGDQASIIGGAIDFVKVLEQLLLSLEAQKKMQKRGNEGESRDGNSEGNSLTGISSSELCATNHEQTSVPEIEATVTQNHVNLKIQCSKKQGQLLKAIISLEELRLTVLHLNVASSHASVSYSFNLKMEDDCNLASADEIAAAVHQMFDQKDSSLVDEDKNPKINS